MPAQKACPHWSDCLVVLACCLLIYWPHLTVGGFASTEGHRVIPAWTMLDSGNFFRVEMFGQTYLRKPPGMPWAIAASSALLGRTEFAARAVAAACATLMALIALWFGARWYGRPCGLAAGIAQAVAPLFVLGGITAEIEPLNALGTQLACLALIDLLITDPAQPPPTKRPALLIAAAAGIIIAVLAKGPASVPVFIGILIGVCVTSRSLRPLASPALLSTIALAAVVLTPVFILLWINNPPSGAIIQDFSDFTWSANRLRATLKFIPRALASAFPLSLALAFPWGKDARREAAPTVPSGAPPERGFRIAHTLAIAWFAATGALFLIGASNPRYAAPAAVLLPPLVAYAARGLSGVTGRFTRARRIFARCFMLGHPAVWPVILIALACWWIADDRAKPKHQESRLAGQRIAAQLPDRAELWADDAVEARPDVLLYTERAAAAAGKHIQPRWMKTAFRSESPGVTSPHNPIYLLLRVDAGSDELTRLQSGPGWQPLKQIDAMTVGQYQLVLLKLG